MAGDNPKRLFYGYISTQSGWVNGQYYTYYTAPSGTYTAVTNLIVIGASDYKIRILLSDSTSCGLWGVASQGGITVNIPTHIVLNPGDSIQGYLRTGGDPVVALFGVESS